MFAFAAFALRLHACCSFSSMCAPQGVQGASKACVCCCPDAWIPHWVYAVAHRKACWWAVMALHSSCFSLRDSTPLFEPLCTACLPCCTTALLQQGVSLKMQWSQWAYIYIYIYVWDGAASQMILGSSHHHLQSLHHLDAASIGACAGLAIDVQYRLTYL